MTIPMQFLDKNAELTTDGNIICARFEVIEENATVLVSAPNGDACGASAGGGYQETEMCLIYYSLSWHQWCPIQRRD